MTLPSYGECSMCCCLYGDQARELGTLCPRCGLSLGWRWGAGTIPADHPMYDIPFKVKVG